MKTSIQITVERIPAGFRAIAWDIDEETGAKCCMAIAESETRKDAIRTARFLAEVA